jgi:hypothetical protein
MSRDIGDRCLKTSETTWSLLWLVVSAWIEDQLSDQAAILMEDPDVSAGGQEDYPLS